MSRWPGAVRQRKIRNGGILSPAAGRHHGLGELRDDRGLVQVLELLEEHLEELAKVGLLMSPNFAADFATNYGFQMTEFAASHAKAAFLRCGRLPQQIVVLVLGGWRLPPRSCRPGAHPILGQQRVQTLRLNFRLVKVLAADGGGSPLLAAALRWRGAAGRLTAGPPVTQYCGWPWPDGLDRILDTGKYGPCRNYHRISHRYYI
jgi:hypothetical protein